MPLPEEKKPLPKVSSSLTKKAPIKEPTWEEKIAKEFGTEKYLNANVEITLLETESLCSKAQAEQMLKKFFDTYPSKTINIKHRGASAQGAKYAIASYETESGLKFRLYIFMKNNLIHELKVERE